MRDCQPYRPALSAGVTVSRMLPDKTFLRTADASSRFGAQRAAVELQVARPQLANMCVAPPIIYWRRSVEPYCSEFPRRWVWGSVLALTLVVPHQCLSAQVRGSAPPVKAAATAARDSAEAAQNFENLVALVLSGVWDIDGEYKGPDGVYYKLSGYFAYVSSTTTSRDDGDRAVMSMYLEPMAGGASSWLGATLRCSSRGKDRGPGCRPTQAAKQILALNFLFPKYPTRGDTVNVEITQPDSTSGPARLTSTYTPRGKFVLLPPHQ